MSNVGLIAFYNHEKREKKGFIAVLTRVKRMLFIKAKRLFSTGLPKGSIKEIMVDGNFSLFFIRIPYTLDELKNSRRFTIRRIQKTVSKICRDNSIKKCICPQKTPDEIITDCCIKNPFSGYFIYTLLLVNILKIVSAGKDKKIRELNIAILDGHNWNLLYYFIKKLSPLAKFLTVITGKKEQVQKKIEDIFDETGLSVRVTDDIASGLDDVNVFINIGNLGEFSIRKKIVCNAIVINYGDIKTNQIEFMDVIINRINVGLPTKIEGLIDKGFFNYYNRTEIAEIILVNELNIGINIFKDYADYNIIESISERFKDEGYTISDDCKYK